jgi:hypothetical protein
MITVTCIEWGLIEMESKRYAAASCLFKIWTVIEPDEMHSWLNLARSYAFMADIKQCLPSLREAMKHGLKTKQRILNDEAFRSMKNEKLFKEMLDKLQQ